MRMGSFAEGLARRRVPLGFVSAAAALILARPTWRTWCAGFVVALAGESVRLWAAGHLEKGREVTRSGPYRVMRHPLYAGSTLIAVGAAVASRSLTVALITGAYMGVTIAAAIRVEEDELRRTFGDAYDAAYRRSHGAGPPRRFSLKRALRNREHRAVLGLLAGFALLALRTTIGR
jgi:protein-S-isoprenylcysteine O-methyltransferase Ste14